MSWVTLWCALIVACAPRPTEEFRSPADPWAATTNEFRNPERVSIEGYGGDAMEPFLSRDGRELFFNNLNEPGVNTNLHWAVRIDDLHFKYRGELAGVNTPALEGVPSMDRDGNFYFVSTRSYERTSSTLYRGKYANGAVSGIEIVPGVSLEKPGMVNFDAEISADGNTLYFVESEFSIFGKPKYAHILMARRVGNRFVRDAAGSRNLASINSDALTYAPATSASELEIYFTRVTPQGPAIYMATRANKSLAFGLPMRLAAISGFVEGPTLSPDGNSLYFHKKEEGRLVFYRVTRAQAGP
jgi:hypothetical protein